MRPQCAAKVNKLLCARAYSQRWQATWAAGVDKVKKIGATAYFVWNDEVQMGPGSRLA